MKAADATAVPAERLDEAAIRSRQRGQGKWLPLGAALNSQG